MTDKGSERMTMDRSQQGLRSKASTPISESVEDLIPEGNHIVAVANMTDDVIQLVRINGGEWRPTAYIGRTCAYGDCRRCMDEEKFAPLVLVDCGQTIRIEVGFQRNGQWFSTGWDPFTPSCSYKGTVICKTN